MRLLAFFVVHLGFRANGMVAVFMVQCPGSDQWAARDLFLKTATQVFQKDAR
ncbi:MAG: hypothetical protein HZA90_15955 [Verrucomicrobia bacterium]|nr:hypothetical protein [Verrucomicrobiota bacterium]